MSETRSETETGAPSHLGSILLPAGVSVSFDPRALYI
jgi:hypothetical protein